MAPRFPSKIDRWFWVVLAAPAVVAALGVAVPAWPALGIAALLFGFLLWLAADTWYEVGDGELRVRCGPLRWRIPLGAIDGVDEAPSPEARIASGPALSLHRMIVRYHDGGGVAELAVPPADRAGFLAALGVGQVQARR
ncbi:MAG: PH domain-containing protein [Terriglobales bacterium]